MKRVRCPLGKLLRLSWPSADSRLRASLDPDVGLLAHSSWISRFLRGRIVPRSFARLGASFRSMYASMPVMVTCECAESGPQACSAPKARDHPSIPAMTIVDVPYDFGLSRGKRLLAQSAGTEFILVLDDDFVRSPLSCVECMLLHMRSSAHALPLPFDLLGFPILEDEPHPPLRRAARAVLAPEGVPASGRVASPGWEGGVFAIMFHVVVVAMSRASSV